MKWQRKHRMCSGCLGLIAFIFMVISSVHLLFPPKFDQMMKHHQRGPHEWQAPAEHGDRQGHHNGEDDEQDYYGHGGRHLKHGHGKNRKDDEEIFNVKNYNNFGDLDEDWFPKMTFKNNKKGG